ncbi:uncharacterized protein LOC144585146 [Pogona vitticeps]
MAKMTTGPRLPSPARRSSPGKGKGRPKDSGWVHHPFLSVDQNGQPRLFQELCQPMDGRNQWIAHRHHRKSRELPR